MYAKYPHSQRKIIKTSHIDEDIDKASRNNTRNTNGEISNTISNNYPINKQYCDYSIFGRANQTITPRFCHLRSSLLHSNHQVE